VRRLVEAQRVALNSVDEQIDTHGDASLPSVRMHIGELEQGVFLLANCASILWAWALNHDAAAAARFKERHIVIEQIRRCGRPRSSHRMPPTLSRLSLRR
jgi:hypothetical protein